MNTAHLTNPATILHEFISDSHRDIAKKFVERISKPEAVRIFRYFENDVSEVRRFLTGALGSYYMTTTATGERNEFISDWVCRNLLEKITCDENI